MNYMYVLVVKQFNASIYETVCRTVGENIIL